MNYAVFDIEAENWIHFKVLGFWDGERYQNFFSISDFFSYIDKRKYRDFRFYAHNAGKYDDNFLYEEMFRRGWKLRFIERGGRMICVDVETKRTSFTIVDSYASLPASLKELSRAFDVRHKKSSFNFEGKINAHNRDLLRYLRNDCYCLAEVLESYFENDLIVDPKITIASQALDTFVQKFQPCSLIQTSIEYEDLFRKYFYRGGRVEVFKGHGTVNEYDVNSLFPFVMLSEMPTGQCKRVREYKKGQIGFYCVELSSVPQFYVSPLLVYRKKNFFVNGKGTYYLSSAMLEHLRSQYGIRFKVHWGLVFHGKEHLFNEYVTTLYELKRTAKDSATREIAKKLLNCLYGKLGQTRTKETVTTRTARHTENFASFNDEFGLILVLQESKSQFILPYLAAYITDLARLCHFKLMEQHPRDMFYCDTDSLFTSADYTKDVSDKIGALSFKGKWEGIFLGAKTYAKRNKKEEIIHFKGFQARNFSFSDFKRALNEGLQLQSEDFRILSFKECIGGFDRKGTFRSPRKKGIIDTAGQFLKRARIIKKVETPYEQRRMVPSKQYGFDTAPFERKELDID